MISPNAAALEPLRPDSIQEALRSKGPCLTILLPPYRKGSQAQSTATLLNTNIRDATRQLKDRNVPEPEIKSLLDPLRELAKDAELLGGSHWGRAIFRSAELFRQFYLTQPAPETLTIAACFFIRPILSGLQLPPEFYILKLSKKRVSLLRCADFQTTPVALPKRSPETLDEALALDRPDHDLENRSAAGSSGATRRGIRFGTGDERETQQTYVADFYKIVDRGVHQLLNGRRAPLILMGVEEDTALFRSVTTYPNLTPQSIHGSPDGSVHGPDLLREAYAVIRAGIVESTKKDLVEWRERAAPARFSTDPGTILQAAFDGRVDRIYIEEGAQRTGVFEIPAKKEYRCCGEEDLLNLAAVETVLQSGKAFAMPDGSIGSAGVAAVFRY